MKNFVGGYYDDRIFKGEYFEGKTPFDKKIDCYTLEETLNLPFIEGVKEWFEENDDEERDFDEIVKEEKIKAILEYVESDEIAGLVYFETEEEAEKFKQDNLEEIKRAEENSIYIGKKQDQYGNYRDVYEHRNGRYRIVFCNMDCDENNTEDDDIDVLLGIVLSYDLEIGSEIYGYKVTNIDTSSKKFDKDGYWFVVDTDDREVYIAIIDQSLIME